MTRPIAIAAGAIAGLGIAGIARRELGAHLLLGALAGGLVGWGLHWAGARDLWDELTNGEDDPETPAADAGGDEDEDEDGEGRFDA